MLNRLYSEKGAGGVPNLEFNDEEIFSMLTPKAAVENALDLRKSLAYNLKEYYIAEAKGENTDEYFEKLTDCRRKIISQYSSTQSTFIPILLEDLKTKRANLLKEAESISAEEESDMKLLPAGKSGELYIAEDGTLQIAEPQAKSTELIPADGAGTTALAVHNIGQELAVALEGDYEANALHQNNYVKSLIVSTYAPLADAPTVKGTTSLEIAQQVEELDKKINEFEDVYCTMRENFINEVSKLIEKLLGVKIFFDHATVGGGEHSKLPEPVIIANCTASKLLKIEDTFRRFIKHRGKDQTDERIWFAVLPNVMEKNIVDAPVKKKTDGPLGGPLGAIKPSKPIDEAEVNYTSVNAALKFLNIMEEARVLTVMSIREKSGNTFGDLTVEEVRSKMERLPKDKPHAVYAYPNFTLSRERPGFKPFKPYSERTIALPGIFIDAAYPAAGLLVASQQHEYLEAHGFRGLVSADNPCVRVDLEADDVKKNIVTKFNRELALRWSENLRNAITKKMFGFAFCGDVIYDKGQPLKNAYVLCARTLSMDKKQVHYRPIYYTLMEDYMAVYLTENDIHGLSSARKFINSTVEGDWAKRYRSIGDECPNLILRAGETMYVDMKKKRVMIRFLEEDSEVYDVQIESEDAKPTERK